MSTEPSRNPVQREAIVIDGISYIPSSALLTGIPKISFKDNLSFAVVDPNGESPRIYSNASELGFYYKDTRYIGIWEMTFNGMSGVALANEVRLDGSTAVFSLANRDFPKLGSEGRIPRDTFLIRKVLSFYEDILFETVEIKNFASETHSLQVEQWIGGRFEDIFEVRGYTRAKRGKMLSPIESHKGGCPVTVLQYEGLDEIIRKCHIYRLFNAEKVRLSPGLAGYFTRVEIPAKSTVALKTVVSFDREVDCKIRGIPFEQLSIPEKMKLLVSGGIAAHFEPVEFHTNNAILNRAIKNAQTDIYTLLTEEPNKILYPYAGIPWFSAPFGRDGIITAYQMLPWYPTVARGVLDYAFGMLGKSDEPFTDEQPGKVFHEMRRGEMANTREVPFIPYYGSVDSTPLSLILLHEYVRWTMDIERLKSWWPSALKALDWVENWGDSDRDGFIEYSKKSRNGLVNQGWKDSHNSVMHKDGRLAHAPIRLCEVQGYAFRARRNMATLAQIIGEHDLANRLRLEALKLKALFAEKFWDAQEKLVYLAIDGDGSPCAVRSSNMGHCLWSEILNRDEAKEIAKHLLSESMFSGYGVRTLADTEVAYNPLSYHNGSVWPHDNSIIMEGLRSYGFTSELEKLASGLIGVLESSEDFRLPELFCGFRRRGAEPPVPYEVACKPQAWAAGSVYLMLKSLLGISMETDQNYLVFNSPVLPSGLKNLEIRGLKGRDWEIDFVLRKTTGGTTVDVTRRVGKVRVLTVK